MRFGQSYEFLHFESFQNFSDFKRQFMQLSAFNFGKHDSEQDTSWKLA